MWYNTNSSQQLTRNIIMSIQFKVLNMPYSESTAIYCRLKELRSDSDIANYIGRYTEFLTMADLEKVVTEYYAERKRNKAKIAYKTVKMPATGKDAIQEYLREQDRIKKIREAARKCKPEPIQIYPGSSLSKRTNKVPITFFKDSIYRQHRHYIHMQYFSLKNEKGYCPKMVCDVRLLREPRNPAFGIVMKNTGIDFNINSTTALFWFLLDGNLPLISEAFLIANNEQKPLIVNCNPIVGEQNSQAFEALHKALSNIGFKPTPHTLNQWVLAPCENANNQPKAMTLENVTAYLTR